MAGATFVYVLGMGGIALDPGGAAQIRNRVIGMFQRLPLWAEPNRLQRLATKVPELAASGGITVPGLFRQAAVGNGNPSYDVAAYIATRPRDEIILYAADSCGANKFAWVASKLKSLGRKVHYAALIQPSTWCNAGEPNIPDNVEEFVNIYASAILTLGLGNKKVQPVNTLNEHGVHQTLRYPGNYQVNNGRTLARYVYVNDVHPGDTDVANVQNPILADIKRVIAAHQQASTRLGGGTGFGAK